MPTKVVGGLGPVGVRDGVGSELRLGEGRAGHHGHAVDLLDLIGDRARERALGVGGDDELRADDPVDGGVERRRDRGRRRWSVAVTRARPIIRAEAVAADRRGCRAALSTASRPTVPKMRGRGQPMTAGHRGGQHGAEDDGADQQRAGRRDPPGCARSHRRSAHLRPGPGDSERPGRRHRRSRARAATLVGSGGVVTKRSHRRDLRGASGREPRRDDGEDDAQRHPDHERARPRAAAGCYPARARMDPKNAPEQRRRPRCRAGSRATEPTSPTTSDSASTDRIT